MECAVFFWMSRFHASSRTRLRSRTVLTSSPRICSFTSSTPSSAPSFSLSSSGLEAGRRASTCSTSRLFRVSFSSSTMLLMYFFMSNPGTLGAFFRGSTGFALLFFSFLLPPVGLTTSGFTFQGDSFVLFDWVTFTGTATRGGTTAGAGFGFSTTAGTYGGVSFGILQTLNNHLEHPRCRNGPF